MSYLVRCRHPCQCCGTWPDLDPPYSCHTSRGAVGTGGWYSTHAHAALTRLVLCGHVHAGADRFLWGAGADEARRPALRGKGHCQRLAKGQRAFFVWYVGTHLYCLSPHFAGRPCLCLPGRPLGVILHHWTDPVRGPACHTLLLLLHRCSAFYSSPVHLCEALRLMHWPAPPPHYLQASQWRCSCQCMKLVPSDSWCRREGCTPQLMPRLMLGYGHGRPVVRCKVQ